MIRGVIQKNVNSIPWQDFRGSSKGMVLFYNSESVAELPIREVPEEIPSSVIPDPNYETGTYGLYGCIRPKIRNTFAKSKTKYMFFMTKYAGTNYERQDEVLITGYYRINKTSDVKKLHIRYLNEYSCMNDDVCTAFRADEIKFVSLEDAFVLTKDILESWGYTSRITKQSRIAIDEEKTKELLEYFSSKDDCTKEYIEETKRLEPSLYEDNEDDDD